MQTKQQTEIVHITPGEVWSDLHQSLAADAEGGIKRSVNIDAVITSIDNILRTHPFERVMRSTFASNLNLMVFDPISQRISGDIAREVNEKIAMWDDRVIVNSIDITEMPDRNLIEVQLSFSIRGYDSIFRHAVALSSGA